jgi:hypothetical protein
MRMHQRKVPMARPTGSREYRGDNLLCVAMARLILHRKARSAWDAAKQLADQAGQRSYGTRFERRVRRLHELYRDREPTWIAWAMKDDANRPRSGLAAALYSMQLGLAHMRSVQWRARRRQKELTAVPRED